ncbi:hypothetical protein Cva_00672 [Caedimonas varicaedens]|uniref:PD-(D/E)XK nuclease superfamily protein n=1 Tax=Caedimonas varicaedens TaxID=1629334 RepID=A0A0K8MDV3_9PROT|nr:hypothetical protein Cva_00672 [Caedimonas varicaedens]
MLDLNDTFSEKLNRILDLKLEQQRNEQPPRDYLGASRMGVTCGRALQYEYMNTLKDVDKGFSGRSLRIFEMGHAIEEMTREWLRQIGFTIVTHKNGNPIGFATAGERIKGHVDGVILEAPSELRMTFPALWECKSMNSKSWNATALKGVREAHPTYAVQMAVYQAYVPGLAETPALFTAVNKDTAELYHELVPFDASLAQEASDRAVQILKEAETEHLYPRITTDRTSFLCRFCAWFKTCWQIESS